MEDKAIDDLEKWDDTALVDAFEKAMKNYPNGYQGREATVEVRAEEEGGGDDAVKEDEAEARFAKLLQQGSPKVDPSSGYGTWQPAVPPLHPPVATGDDGLSDLLASWYYAGYYTGRYRAFQEMKQQQSS